MKADHLCHVRFTWKEVRSALAAEIEALANDEIVGSERNQQLLTLAENARKDYSHIEYTEDEEGVILIVDGVAFTEEL